MGIDSAMIQRCAVNSGDSSPMTTSDIVVGASVATLRGDDCARGLSFCFLRRSLPASRRRFLYSCFLLFCALEGPTFLRCFDDSLPPFFAQLPLLSTRPFSWRSFCRL